MYKNIKSISSLYDATYVLESELRTKLKLQMFVNTAKLLPNNSEQTTTGNFDGHADSF